MEIYQKPLEAIFRKPLSSAPPRLQGMLLKYCIEVQYKRGKELYVADALSRVQWTEELESNDQEVQVNLVTHHLDTPGIGINYLKTKTKEDLVLQKLKEATLEGWPDVKKEAPVESHAYWNFRDEIRYVDGLLHKMNRITVPKQLRSKVLKHIHKSHQGMERSLKFARDLVTLVMLTVLNKPKRT